jgi:hypothetical protein
LIDEVPDLLNRIDGAIAVIQQFDRELRERARITAELARLLQRGLPRLRFDAVAFGRRAVTDSGNFNEPTHLSS